MLTLWSITSQGNEKVVPWLSDNEDPMVSKFPFSSKTSSCHKFSLGDNKVKKCKYGDSIHLIRKQSSNYKVAYNFKKGRYKWGNPG